MCRCVGVCVCRCADTVHKCLGVVGTVAGISMAS